MHQLVQDNMNEIQAMCAKHRVRKLELFGSAATDEFDPAHSDFDFLVEFADMSPEDHADAYFGLMEDLASLLGRAVDLTESCTVHNPYLKQSIAESRTVVYDAA